MRVLIATAHRAVVGGVETYLRALLPALAARGHDIALVASHPAPPAAGPAVDDGVPGIPVWDAADRAGPGGWRPDICYLHGLPDPAAEAALIDRFPTVQYAHNHVGMCVSGTKFHATTGRACSRRLGPGCLAVYLPLGRARDLLVGGRPAPPPAGPPPEGDVDWVTGSFFLVRRACLDAVGPLDEQFFVYNEDIDWCFQARKKGWQVRFWPGASMVHFGSSSAAQLADKTFMLYRNELRYFRKNHNPLAVAAYYAAMTARLAAGAAAQAGKWLVGRARWADVRERAARLANFAAARSDRRGLSGS